jgi:hypothetical protein
LLNPGQSFDFTFAEYVPTDLVTSGTYSFFDQLQLFQASDTRPPLGSSSFGGSFQVVAAPIAAPEPSSVALMIVGVGGLIFAGKRRLG